MIFKGGNGLLLLMSILFVGACGGGSSSVGIDAPRKLILSDGQTVNASATIARSLTVGNGFGSSQSNQCNYTLVLDLVLTPEGRVVNGKPSLTSITLWRDSEHLPLKVAPWRPLKPTGDARWNAGFCSDGQTPALGDKLTAVLTLTVDGREGLTLRSAEATLVSLDL